MALRMRGLIITSQPAREKSSVGSWLVRMSRPKWEYAQSLQSDGALAPGPHYFSDPNHMVAAIGRHLEHHCDCDDPQTPEPCIPHWEVNGIAPRGRRDDRGHERVMCVSVGHVLAFPGPLLTGQWALARQVWTPSGKFMQYRSFTRWHAVKATMTRTAVVSLLAKEVTANPKFADYPGVFDE